MALEGTFPLVNVLLMLFQVGALYKRHSAVASERALASVGPEVVIEFTWALHHSMTSVLEFAVEESQITAQIRVFLELVHDVLVAVWDLLLVLGLGVVEIFSKYHSEAP